MRGASATPAETRARILATADALFDEGGLAAVRVDRVVSRSGLAKRTVYRHFASKEALLRAMLAEQDRAYWAPWVKRLQGWSGDPRAQLEMLVSRAADFGTDPESRGCPFLNVAIEQREPGAAGYAEAHAHKRELQRRIVDLARQAGAADAVTLGHQLYLLIEGVYAAGRLADAAAMRLAAVEAARTLLHAALSPRGAAKAA